MSRGQNHLLAAPSLTAVLGVSDWMKGHSHPPRMDRQAASRLAQELQSWTDDERAVHLDLARPRDAAAVTVGFAAERSAAGAAA